MELCDEGGATLAAFEAGEGPLVFEVVQPEGLSSLLCILIPDGPVADTGAYLRLRELELRLLTKTRLLK